MVAAVQIERFIREAAHAPCALPGGVVIAVARVRYLALRIHRKRWPPMDGPTTAILRDFVEVGRLPCARETLGGLFREVGGLRISEVLMPETNQLLVELPVRRELEAAVRIFVEHATSCLGASTQIALDGT